jgi:hypothetical protein
VPPETGYLAFKSFDDTYEKKSARPDDAAATGLMLTYFYVNPVQKDPEFHALARLDLAADAEAHRVEMQVTRGRTVTGVLLDHEGQPLAGGWYHGRGESPRWYPITGGKFLVATYDPANPRRVTFVHHERKLAGTHVIAGEIEGEIRVKLKPWGAVTGRVVNADGDGVPNMLIHSGSMTMLMSSGPSPDAWDDDTPPLPLPPPEGEPSPNIITDENGRFTIAGLVPGMKYGLMGFERSGGPGQLQGDIARDLLLEPGQTLDLGDVKLDKPDQDALRREAEKRAEEAKRNREVEFERNEDRIENAANRTDAEK